MGDNDETFAEPVPVWNAIASITPGPTYLVAS